MKSIILLACGLCLLLTGITLHIHANSWAQQVISQQPGATISQVDPDKQEAYTYTGDQLRILGIVMISLGAFSWIKSPARKD